MSRSKFLSLVLQLTLKHVWNEEFSSFKIIFFGYGIDYGEGTFMVKKLVLMWVTFFYSQFCDSEIRSLLKLFWAGKMETKVEAN